MKKVIPWLLPLTLFLLYVAYEIYANNVPDDPWLTTSAVWVWALDNYGAEMLILTIAIFVAMIGGLTWLIWHILWQYNENKKPPGYHELEPRGKREDTQRR